MTTLELMVWAEGDTPIEQEIDYGVVRRDGVWLMDSIVLGR